MSEPLLSVVHVLSSLRKSAGGTTRVVVDLCSELGRLGLRLDLLSQNVLRAGHVVNAGDDGNLLPPDWLVTTTILPTYVLPFQGGRLSFRKALRRRCNHSQAMLIHSHGLWMPVNHSTSVIARNLGIPVIVSPHGMLEPFALKRRAWKKGLAWRLYQHRDVMAARLLHATATQEAENLRRLGLRQPIAIIPNGVRMPAVRSNGEHLRRDRNGRRTALFLSRIHPIKGVLSLIDAWGKLTPLGWRLCLAGPDHERHLAQVMQRVRSLGLESSVEYVGEVEGEVKAALFESASLFVLPTFSENFGVVIAEALAYGVPVITTHGAPWEGLISHRCGWWVEPSVDALTDALGQALNMDDSTLRLMGERGRTYAKEFDWTRIAEQMTEVYRWVLGFGPRPTCVATD